MNIRCSLKSTWVKEILVAWHVVAKDIVSLPATKEGKAWPEIQLHRVAEYPHVWCRDVSDLITVVDICSSCRQDGLKRLALTIYEFLVNGIKTKIITHAANLIITHSIQDGCHLTPSVKVLPYFCEFKR